MHQYQNTRESCATFTKSHDLCSFLFILALILQMTLKSDSFHWKLLDLFQSTIYLQLAVVYIYRINRDKRYMTQKFVDSRIYDAPLFCLLVDVKGTYHF
jgi:hypothetical protein